MSVTRYTAGGVGAAALCSNGGVRSKESQNSKQRRLQHLSRAAVIGPVGQMREALCKELRQHFEEQPRLVPRNARGRPCKGAFLQHHRHAEAAIIWFLNKLSCLEGLPSSGVRLLVHARYDTEAAPPETLDILRGRGLLDGPPLEFHLFNKTAHGTSGYHYDPLFVPAGGFPGIRQTTPAQARKRSQRSVDPLPSAAASSSTHRPTTSSPSSGKQPQPTASASSSQVMRPPLQQVQQEKAAPPRQQEELYCATCTQLGQVCPGCVAEQTVASEPEEPSQQNRGTKEEAIALLIDLDESAPEAPAPQQTSQPTRQRPEEPQQASTSVVRDPDVPPPPPASSMPGQSPSEGQRLAMANWLRRLDGLPPVQNLSDDDDDGAEDNQLVPHRRSLPFADQQTHLFTSTDGVDPTSFAFGANIKQAATAWAVKVGWEAAGIGKFSTPWRDGEAVAITGYCMRHAQCKARKGKSVTFNGVWKAVAGGEVYTVVAKEKGDCVGPLSKLRSKRAASSTLEQKKNALDAIKELAQTGPVNALAVRTRLAEQKKACPKANSLRGFVRRATAKHRRPVTRNP